MREIGILGLINVSDPVDFVESVSVESGWATCPDIPEEKNNDATIKKYLRNRTRVFIGGKYRENSNHVKISSPLVEALRRGKYAEDQTMFIRDYSGTWKCGGVRKAE